MKHRIGPASDSGGSGSVQLSLFEDEVPQLVAQHQDSPEPVHTKSLSSTSTSLDEAPSAESAETVGAIARRPLPGLLSACCDDYMEYLTALNRSKHTRESFALDLRLLLQFLGDVQVNSIGERELRSFVSHVRLERANSATSVRRKIASLKNFFSYMKRERIIADDPSMRLIYPEIYPALPEFLEEAQVEALAAAASEHDSWLALIQLLLETGLKRDEVVALGRTDVVLQDHIGNESYLVVRETEQSKRLRSRRLEISPAIAALLRQFIAEEPARERFFDLSPRGVNFVVETCGKRARIATKGPRLTPQILRETFAVRNMRRMVEQEDAARDAGVDVIQLNELTDQHDRELLRMMGLFEEPESARKYRKLVRGWSQNNEPPAAPRDPARFAADRRHIE